MPKLGALPYALRLLKYRMRSKSEVVERMKQKGYPETEIADTVSDLEKNQLIDDELFAKSLTRGRMAISHRGKRAVLWELRQKGVDKELASKTLSEVTPEVELETAKELLEGRQRVWRGLDPATIKRRMIGLLQRRGFSMDIILKLLREL